MSWITSTLVLSLRRVGRRLGLNSYIARALFGDGYEASYDKGFQELLKPGDCVWDVGANVGLYTLAFSDRIGNDGYVFAFEPSPINYASLLGACGALSNVRVLNIGLGASEGVVAFQQGADKLGATSRVVPGEVGGAQVAVQISSADELIRNGSVKMPNAIKIDVEGFEPEVIEGLSVALSDLQLRLIGIEMHFGLLQERGLPNAPRSIEALLINHGFSIRWPDSSHILAVRV